MDETPPRLWGRPRADDDARLGPRNTPTPVGKTLPDAMRLPLDAKHPHACGEDGTYHPQPEAPCETPPRLWGRRDISPTTGGSLRNTPTPVGKTEARAGFAGQRAKHPHACGEDHTMTDAPKRVCETPPRLWGRPSPYSRQGASLRNTPTPVGKTPSSTSKIARDAKHPHACGEDLFAVRAPVSVTETPPRLWGRPTETSDSLASSRNTPTPVGKTIVPAATLFWATKHPHACGEDPVMKCLFGVTRETPPRLWGRRTEPLAHAKPLRNTPTPVGKT